MKAADRKAPPLSREVFKAANRRAGVVKCSLALALDALSPGDREEARAAIADPTIQSVAISTVLRTRGAEVGPSTIQRHRRHGCSRCDVKAMR